MPLVRKMYRGTKVWVEVDEQGRLVEERGLVPMRYRQEDERSYTARAAEVEEIDEAKLSAAKDQRQRKARKKATGAARKGPSVDSLPDNAVVVFTDGACYGNPGPAGIGALLEWKGHTKEISAYLGEGTNNIAELTAIREALKIIKTRGRPVHLYTDSSYAIGVLSGGWKVKENRELVAEIQVLMEQFADLHLHKVKGHSGDPRNERADQLARDGIDHHQA